MSTNGIMMTGGEALVAALAGHGVDTIFGIPGTHNLSAYAAMARHGIRHVSARHEQGRDTPRTATLAPPADPAWW